jgi:hypothetical protein
VWIGQISYEISGSNRPTSAITYQIDPDIDDARMYLLQNFWYSQSLARMGFAKGGPRASYDAPAQNFGGSDYFTDGRRVVLFLSEKPVAMDEVDLLPWETLSLE